MLTNKYIVSILLLLLIIVLVNSECKAQKTALETKHLIGATLSTPAGVVVEREV
ncbi:hypothetical protein I2I11_17015 [Pontibacter sp. 172403-2]|uniref:hypothetical protein n=1 Tax=Pontibacter rufus TaxID=2791028 RepID=UPI0018AFEEE5|nr:hypothetical protein [Pontibacter sp. 172403-2]MBF9255005.1 hypothetical protein [Pontibacter sp. 172403-2]